MRGVGEVGWVGAVRGPHPPDVVVRRAVLSGTIACERDLLAVRRPSRVHVVRSDLGEADGAVESSLRGGLHPVDLEVAAPVAGEGYLGAVRREVALYREGVRV